jgi:hypothetical protein
VKIISGGQTGADRGALDAAIELGIEHGGWCPKERTAEDGRISERYQLREHSCLGYPPRTASNVFESDATLLLTMGKIGAGSRLTIRRCSEYRKPVLGLNLDKMTDRLAASRIQGFLRQHEPLVLNVAGSRESSSPGIQERVKRVLMMALEGTES